jgi:YhgE/Pip-like protein
VVTKILRSPKVWAPLFAVVILAFFYFLVNFGAAKSPVANTRDLPVAIVNEDAGATMGGERVDLGERVAKSAASNGEIGNKVRWTRLENRQDAVRGIAEGKYYGALVIPPEYSRSIAKLSVPSANGSLEPSRVEILTNPSAGPFASVTVQTILTEIVEGASRTTSERIAGALEARSVQVSPRQAAALGEPVVAGVTDVQPIGENSGRGLMPFYLMFTALILGFIGANALYGGLTFAGAVVARTGREPSRLRLFLAAMLLGLVLALLLGAVESLVAFGIYGVYHEAGVFYALSFLVLVAAVSLFLALVLLVALGPRGGILTGSFFIISVGLATSGGATPVENLPGFFRSLSGVLPFEHMTDGIRALLFYDGRLEAGLGVALRVLTAYLLGSILLGGSISLLRDTVTRRRKSTRGSERGTEGQTVAVDTGGIGRAWRG